MKIRILFLLIVNQYLIYSQEDLNLKYYWNQQKKEAIIGVKNCYIRSASNTYSKLIDSLQIGKKVSVINDTENLLNIKGINTNWAEIEYLDVKNQKQKGYIWKGFLALDFVKSKNLTFLTRIDRVFKKLDIKDNSRNTLFQISVLVLDENNQILSEKSIQKNVLESSYFQDKCIGALGLDKIQEIYRISFSGEACGIPTYYFYFGWNGNELILLPEKMEVGDADVYSHSETFVFPKEKGGKPNFIFKEVEEAEMIGEDSNMYSITTFKETYSWDGEKAQFVSKTKPKKIRKKSE
ncbi:MAG: hypothetical protein QM535_06590 [Limnohabitans sp.]|nr:hypothetical protein [Limnohabitans sp.]